MRISDWSSDVCSSDLLMARTKPWLESHPHGLYVRPADLWIDPARPVERAAVTHGHADHARSGHHAVFATPETLAIMALRYGVDAVAGHNQAVAYGDGFERGGVRFSFHPAGHVLGSAQIAMEYRGERIVVTGDYRSEEATTELQSIMSIS